MHLVLTNDPAKAREEQHEAFLKVMSNERGPAYLESVYLFGTPDEIVASLQKRVDAGVEYFFLHTMTPDPAQLQDWIDHIIPNVKFPANAGPVRRMAAACRGLRTRVTLRVALIGKPLKRRHSVVMHNAAFARPASTAAMSCWRSTRTECRAPWQRHTAPDWLGLGVTAPYKQLVAGLVDEVEPDAREIGAVNNVVRTTDGRLIGFNTDAPGFRAGVEQAHGPAADRRSTSSSPARAASPGGRLRLPQQAAPRGDRRQSDAARQRRAGSARRSRWTGPEFAAAAAHRPTWRSTPRRWA